MDTVLRLAAAGLGVAVVPELALNDAEGLVGLAVADVPMRRTLGLIAHGERQLSPAAAALHALLVDQLRG